MTLSAIYAYFTPLAYVWKRTGKKKLLLLHTDIYENAKISFQNYMVVFLEMSSYFQGKI